MADWPATLYGLILENTFSEAPPDNVIRTPMDAGPTKVRRRSTANIRPITFTLFLTKAKVAILDTFYDSTLQSGALTFNMYHPRTHASGSYRFVERPAYAEMNSGFSARISLELMPS